ncbi:ABC transporter ATP-binding protein [Bacillus sp. B15-48]|uniref:sulfate/molybdate ABC transporter ATP-binding protein n=1 Tax=Bacillus sp. B15-48 TaxID=1548601 RepID=UPI00193F093D|nr:ABC transporter ATP-binding protein [Bacillus sp. B15-48]MBM4761660.1 ATP-binding cassette domain-containing protein [Bacillus sp. B15-48]
MLNVAIKKKFNQFQLHAQFTADRGITGIIGPSGCGKSVTLQCIAGLATPDEGEILLDGRPLFNSKEKFTIKTKNRNIGYVFQNYALFPHLTVEKNIEYGLKGRPKEEKKRRVAKMIEKVQLNGYENHYPNELSGGQQQRVALARTLVTEPDLLLLDEPFSALDHHVKHILEQELLNIIKENYSGIVLLVTHNMEEAYRLCDQLILYKNGEVIQAGNKEEVFTRPKNISAAEVIGCKNILPVHSFIEDDDYLECTVQGIQLMVQKQKIHRAVTHIGIYPEDIQFIKKPMEAVNAFSYEIIEVVKGIHQTALTLKIGHDFTIQASVGNHQLQPLLQGDYQIHLHPDKLFLLENK